MARRPATPAILKGPILIAVWAPHCRSGRPPVLSRSARGCSVVTLASSCLFYGFASRLASSSCASRSPPPPLATVQFLHPLCHPPPPSSPATAFFVRLCSSLSFRGCHFSLYICIYIFFQNSSSGALAITRSLMIRSRLRNDYE